MSKEKLMFRTERGEIAYVTIMDEKARIEIGNKSFLINGKNENKHTKYVGRLLL